MRWRRGGGIALASEILLKFVERGEGTKKKFAVANAGAGRIGGIPFSPSFSLPKVGRGISTKGDGDPKRRDYLNNSSRLGFIFVRALSCRLK